MDNFRSRYLNKKVRANAPREMHASLEAGRHPRGTVSPQIDAFQRFQERGSLLDDKSIVVKRTMALDKKDILRYEEQSRSQSKSPSPLERPSLKHAPHTNRAEFWDGFKSRVMHDLKHGSITNQ